MLSREDIEARVRRRLAELAPPGTAVTPELRAQIIQVIVEELRSKLVEGGMQETQAALVAALVGSVTKVRAK